MLDENNETLPQEIIGLQNDSDRTRAMIRAVLEEVRTGIQQCLEPVIVNKEKLDHRIIALENRLHALNKERAKTYGREYNPPTILYIDRAMAHVNSAIINQKIIEKGLGKFGRFDANGASHNEIGNYILIFVNNFDDKELDSWDIARKLRHELSHSGSVRKHRKYPETYSAYRIGATLFSKKRASMPMGSVLDEGHHTIEDEIFIGQHADLQALDEFLQNLPDIQKMFPGAQQKYELVREQVISAKLMNDDDLLLTYLDNTQGFLVYKAESYNKYSKLMKLIYKINPQLFKLAGDFIYGDNAIAFAREIDSTFRKGFFKNLMEANDEESVSKLISEVGMFETHGHNLFKNIKKLFTGSQS